MHKIIAFHLMRTTTWIGWSLSSLKENRHGLILCVPKKKVNKKSFPHSAFITNLSLWIQCGRNSVSWVWDYIFSIYSSVWNIACNGNIYLFHDARWNGIFLFIVRNAGKGFFLLLISYYKCIKIPYLRRTKCTKQFCITFGGAHRLSVQYYY